MAEPTPHEKESAESPDLEPPSYEKDLEAGKIPEITEQHGVEVPIEVRHGSITNPAEIARARHIQNAWAPFRYMSLGEQWLDDKMGVETQGIDRIPEEGKRPPSMINIFFIWWSMTCHVGTLPIGVLGLCICPPLERTGC